MNKIGIVNNKFVSLEIFLQKEAKFKLFSFKSCLAICVIELSEKQRDLLLHLRALKKSRQ